MRVPTWIVAFGMGACTSVAVQTAAEERRGESSTPPNEVAKATITARSSAPTRVSPNKTGTVAMVARGNNAFMAVLELAAKAEIPEHRDSTEEYIYVLSGSGVMTIDGVEHDLGPEQAVYMPANASVRFRNGSEKMVALQVFSGPEPAKKYDAWSLLD
jgi:quercetin dioxygenase-like cupin family protein